MTVNLPVFGVRENGKLYILRKVDVSTSNDKLSKNAYNSSFMFFNILLFCLKGYSRVL